MVKIPRNITDEDLSTKSADFTRPIGETTPSTYFVLRIALAKISRQAVDTCWDIKAVHEPGHTSYSRIMQLDMMFFDLLETIPTCLTREQWSQSQGILVPPNDEYMKQTLFMHLTTEARRCKIHLPYLLRVQQDPQYNFSRKTCLSSARKILRLDYLLPNGTLTENEHGVSKMSGLLPHFFCAIITLVMDVCVKSRC